MPRTRRRTGPAPFSPAAALVAALLLGAAAVPGCSRPRPDTRPPAPTGPGTPSSQPGATPGVAAPIPADARRGFVYAAGTHRYALTTEAVLDYHPDSASAGYSDTVATAAIVSYTIGDGAGGVRVQVSGSVDSFTVSKVLGSAFGPPGTMSAAPPSTPQAAGGGGSLLFRGTLELTGSRRLELPQTTGTCDSPDDALLIAVREVIAPPPPSLDAGASWQDTVDYAVCRAGIPATTRLVRGYVVEGPAQLDSLSTVPAVRVRRTSALTMTGSAQVREQLVSLSGTGTGTAELFFDPAAGRFLGANAQNEAAVEVSGGTHVRRFMQRGTVRVRVRE